MSWLTDFVGGIASLNRGDVEGFRKGVTKEGRAQSAQEHQNTDMQTQILHGVLQKAQSDPQFNALLQQQLAPFLANEAQRAGTQHTQASTEGVKAQTTAQGLQNIRSGNVNDFFAQHGGSPEAAQFGLQQRQADEASQVNLANIGRVGAETAQTQQQTEGSAYQLKQQQALDKLAQAVGFGNHADMQQFIAQDFKAKELQVQQRGHEQAALSHTLDNFPSTIVGEPSESQRTIIGKMGVNLPVSQQEQMRRQAVELGMVKAKEKMAGKGKQPVGPAQQRQPRQPAPAAMGPVQGPPTPNGPMRNAAESALKKLGFDVNGSNLQKALDILRVLSSGSVDVQLQEQGQQ